MTVRVIHGDAAAVLPTLEMGSFQTCVTSPPYWNLRRYLGADHPDGAKEIGTESTPEAYLRRLVIVFSEVARVLKDNGTLWIVIGDSYHEKQRLLIPARLALALQADSWILRDEIVWHKPRTTPSSVKDRTVPAHEMIYLFAKRPRYYFDYLAIEEPSLYPGAVRKAGKAFRAMAKKDPLAAPKRPSEREMVVRDTRRKRSVWSVITQSYSEGHFGTYPAGLIEPCILAGSKPGDSVLDPFAGAGTTGLVADRLGRDATMIDLSGEYGEMQRNRIAGDAPLFAQVTG